MKLQNLLLILFVFSPDLLHASDSPLHGRRIVLDPGHGVINYEGHVLNPGKVNNRGQMEHKLTMDISQKVGALLEKKGAKVIYTRTPSDYWRESYGTIEDNKNRSVFANELKADAYIAIHCDWYPLRKFKGVTTFYAKPESKRLGQLIHRSMVRQLKARDRTLVFDSYTVLDNVNIPAVLVECGFLSNRDEAKKLSRDSYQKEIAKAMTNGLETYFKELSKTPSDLKQTNN